MKVSILSMNVPKRQFFFKIQSFPNCKQPLKNILLSYFFQKLNFLRLCSKVLNFPLFYKDYLRLASHLTLTGISSDLCSQLMDIKHFKCIHETGKRANDENKKGGKFKSLVKSLKTGKNGQYLLALVF